MAAMSPDPHAGAYLGLWTVSVLIFKGLGTFAGGLLRDIFFGISGLTLGGAYGLAFFLSAVGLGGAILLLNGLDIADFVHDRGRAPGAMDGEIGAVS
jgi:BCD family chlorophyll transporter-like MFS transporter